MTLLEPQGDGVPIRPPTPISQPFWDGCDADRLLFQRCGACGRANFNPAIVCRACRSHDLAWEQSAGDGTVYSWTICWRPQTPAFSAPYAPVIVELDEGYQMLSNLVGCSTDDVCVGMRVTVEFVRLGNRTLPYFRPR